MKLTFRPAALTDIQEARDYISKVLKNPSAAKKLVSMIWQTALLLKTNPYMGAALSGGDIRNQIKAGDIRGKVAVLLRPRQEFVSHVVDRDALGLEGRVIEVVGRAMAGEVAGASDGMDEVENASPTCPRHIHFRRLANIAAGGVACGKAKLGAFDKCRAESVGCCGHIKD